MNEVIHQNVQYAIIHRSEEWKEDLDFLSGPSDFIQVGTWWYNSGKILKSHRHIENKREISHTQECIIVLKGEVLVDLYDLDGIKFAEYLLAEGDLAIMLKGGHGYKILEDNTRIIEVKGGQFTSVENDKELI